MLRRNWWTKCGRDTAPSGGLHRYRILPVVRRRSSRRPADFRCTSACCIGTPSSKRPSPRWSLDGISRGSRDLPRPPLQRVQRRDGTNAGPPRPRRDEDWRSISSIAGTPCLPISKGLADSIVASRTELGCKRPTRRSGPTSSFRHTVSPRRRFRPTIHTICSCARPRSGWLQGWHCLVGGWTVAYQSASGPGQDWLGPSLDEVILELSERGVRQVVLCPFGFVADQVEILYDLDVAQKRQARDLGISVARTRLLNDGSALVESLALLVEQWKRMNALPESRCSSLAAPRILGDDRRLQSRLLSLSPNRRGRRSDSRRAVLPRSRDAHRRALRVGTHHTGALRRRAFAEARHLPSHAATPIRRGVIVALATNGTLIDRDLAKRIRESGVDRVSISFDGADEATHDAFRRLPGSFRSAWPASRRFGPRASLSR